MYSTELLLYSSLFRTVFNNIFVLTYFVPRVMEVRSPPRDFTLWILFGRAPGIEPELLRPQPGVLPKSYYTHTSLTILLCLVRIQIFPLSLYSLFELETGLCLCLSISPSQKENRHT